MKVNKMNRQGMRDVRSHTHVPVAAASVAAARFASRLRFLACCAMLSADLMNASDFSLTTLASHRAKLVVNAAHVCQPGDGQKQLNFLGM